MKRLIKLYLVSFIFIIIPGCVLVPVISGFHDMGATAEARQDLFSKTVKAFHDAIRTGNMVAATKFVTEDDQILKDQIKAEIRRTKEKEKIVSSEVDFLEFDKDSYMADVEVKTKYFEIPYYVVNDRLETERWKFSSVGAQWQIISREVQLMKDGEVVR